MFPPALVDSIYASWGPLPSAEGLVYHYSLSQADRAGPEGGPQHGVGDEREVTALLDPLIYTWFWITTSTPPARLQSVPSV